MWTDQCHTASLKKKYCSKQNVIDLNEAKKEWQRKFCSNGSLTHTPFCAKALSDTSWGQSLKDYNKTYQNWAWSDSSYQVNFNHSSVVDLVITLLKHKRFWTLHFISRKLKGFCQGLLCNNLWLTLTQHIWKKGNGVGLPIHCMSWPSCRKFAWSIFFCICF